MVAVALILCAVGCTRGGEQAGTPLDVKGLHVELPAGWKSVPPASPMRAAQAVIEGPGGPADLAVFHFGAGQGGDVEANLQRWVAQIVPQPGSSPERETFDANGLRITWIDAEGTLQADRWGWDLRRRNRARVSSAPWSRAKAARGSSKPPARTQRWRRSDSRSAACCSGRVCRSERGRLGSSTPINRGLRG
jgi:hypothetical protein